MRLQEIVHETPRTSPPQPSPRRYNWAYTYSIQTRNETCAICENKHTVIECREFLCYSIDGRWQCAKALRFCFRCLSPDHGGRNCPRNEMNERCGKSSFSARHHVLLHDDARNTRPGNFGSRDESSYSSYSRPPGSNRFDNRNAAGPLRSSGHIDQGHRSTPLSPLTMNRPRMYHCSINARESVSLRNIPVWLIANGLKN